MDVNTEPEYHEIKSTKEPERDFYQVEGECN
jgi:hypothetical protein